MGAVFLAQPADAPPRSELDRLREFRRLMQAHYDGGGHITRAEVKAALDATQD